MRQIKVKNKTKMNIPIEDWFDEIKTDANKIPEEAYPLTVVIKKSKYDNKKGHWRYSKFKPDENLIILSIVPETTLRQIKWSFMHEFRHFMQMHIPELRNATHEDIDIDDLKKIISKVFELDDESFYDIFHDIFPQEQDAITYATQKVGKNYRKHKLSDMLKRYKLED